VADTLERLALPLIWLERFPEAQRALDEAKRIREPASEKAPLDLARTLYLEALLHRWDGQYDAAISSLSRSSRTRLALAPGHPDNIADVQLNGDLLFLKGNVRQAEQAWTDALSRAEQTLGKTHPLVPPILHRLAIVAQEFGDLDRKRELLELAIRMAPSTQVPCYPELPALLNDFGTLSTYRGDFQQARSFYDEAFTKLRRCLGPTHSATTTILHNRAVLAADMGDFAGAEELHRQAVRVWSQRLGANHPYVARGLDELAGVASSRGRNVEAARLLERALTIRTQALGPESPDVASTLVTLARTLAQRDAITALQKVDEAIAIYQRGNRPQSPDSVATAFSLRGTLLLNRGDYARGRQAFAMALAERERVFGTDHPLTAEARSAVASADFGLDFVDSAVRDALAAEEIGRNHLRFTIRYLPERQALAYSDHRPRGLDLALSAVAADRTAERASVLDAVVRSRGVVLDELGARAHLTAQSADPVLVSLNAAATAARERFANLMLRSLKGEDPVPRAVLDDARSRKEEAERALAERSAAARTEVEQANVGLTDVREMLPPNTAILAFVRYDRTIVTASGTRSAPRAVASYMGFVIRADTPDVAVVPLGTASSIDGAIAVWRREAEGRKILAGVPILEAERTYRAAGVQIRQQIWDPFSLFIEGAARVFVVPDGAVNFVSFAALPTAPNRYLIEDGPVIHYLSTERDVISRPSVGSANGLLAVGGPAYDARVHPAGSRSTLRSGCATLGGVRFEDLPNSRLEADEIAKIWSSSANEAGDTRVLSGRAATETAIKQAAIGRRVVHLATHGYFLESRCDSAAAGTRAVGGLVAQSGPSRELAENVLLLSGLAFAGANVPSSVRTGQGDDGLLTAEEVAGLNLQGTEWAVLSACDTGTGRIKAGEGVFGLRRAFQVAGVRTIIMSLWPVDDVATRTWMRHLYDARFNQRLSTAESVREASIRVLENRRARRQSLHPLYWAAFVAAGDWQ
jgi:CHAT domain-containing protein/tetratricopeptide (TPR) repeat protein